MSQTVTPTSNPIRLLFRQEEAIQNYVLVGLNICKQQYSRLGLASRNAQKLSLDGHIANDWDLAVAFSLMRSNVRHLM